MKQQLLLLLILLLSISLTAQHKYDIGLEGGFLFQQYKLNDPSGILKKHTYSYTPNGIGSIALQINTLQHWVYKISAGYYVINYNYGMEQNDTYYSGQGYAEHFFAMGNIGYKLPVTKKLAIIPLVGIALNINNYYDSKQDYDSPYSTGIEFNSRQPPTLFATANGGIELQYATGKRIKLMLAGNYMLGFTKRAEHNINYKVRNGAMQYATMTSHGSFLYYNAGVSYGFGK